jgi:hypothetical protein
MGMGRLMSETIKVEQLQSINLEKNEVLVVSIDTNHMPANQAMKRMKNVRDVIKGKLPGNNEVLVIPSHITLSKLSAHEAKQLKAIVDLA